MHTATQETTPPPDAEPPPPPPFSSAPLALTPLRPDDLLPLLTRPSATPQTLAQVLRAHALAAAEHFEDLLSLGSLSGVESHAYQVETVRRVLRTLGGRALLADEVGLGKTIEAIMILREYQLRGLARRVLVLAPAPLCPQWVGELAAKAGVTARTTDDPLLRSDPAAFWHGEGVLVASLALGWPFTRSVANQLREHDDRAEFLAGIDLILAGIAA